MASGIIRMILKNCRLIENNKEVVRNIVIEDGKIKAIVKSELKGWKTIDVKGNYVLPGLIDPHVHARDLEQSYKEDFYTASRAAAVGGVTTFFDMPNSKPPTTSLDALELKRKKAKLSIVNYGFNFGGDFHVPGTPGNKLYMDITTGHMIVKDISKIESFFKNTKMLMVHAEDKNAELSIKLSKKHHTKLYVCHLSLKSEVDFIRKHKDKRIFCEVSPHHLFMNKDAVNKIGPFARMKPSLKEESHRLAMWNGIKDGTIDVIGTDHAPHTIEEKKSNEPPYGVPGLETMLPLLLDSVNKGMLTLPEVVKLTSKNPAKIFKIKNKGDIKVGYDADLVIIDMNLKKKVIRKNLQTKCKWSPFEGTLLKGWPVMTIVNGNVVFDHGKIIDRIKGKEVKIEDDL